MKRDDELRQRVKALHEQKEPDLSVRAIAEIVGRSRSRVADLIKDMGLEPKPRIRPRRRRDEEDADAGA